MEGLCSVISSSCFPVKESKFEHWLFKWMCVDVVLQSDKSHCPVLTRLTLLRALSLLFAYLASPHNRFYFWIFLNLDLGQLFMLRKFPLEFGPHHTNCKMVFSVYTPLRTVARKQIFLMSCDFAALLWLLLGVPGWMFMPTGSSDPFTGPPPYSSLLLLASCAWTTSHLIPASGLNR